MSAKLRSITNSLRPSKWGTKHKMAIAVLICLMLVALAVTVLPPTEPREDKYRPTIDLPENYIVLVEEPRDLYDMTFIAALSSVVVHNDNYNPMFILDDGSLDQHQLWTIQHLNLAELPALLFTDNPDIAGGLREHLQIDDTHIYPKTPWMLANFRGYSDFISVASYEEALWVAPLAKIENKVIKIGQSSFTSQEQVWDRLKSHGLNADYIVITNPNDVTVEMLEEQEEGYDFYDSQYHIPALSAVAAELAAYHEAYVMTSAPLSTEQIGVMDVELNARPIGLYLKLKELSNNYGPPEYVCIVGSAAAVPQFQLPGNGDGDVLVNCDVIFGFLDEDKYTMDAAVGRIVNLNVQGASNQIVRTFLYDSVAETVSVEYSDMAGGTQEVNWRYHGASFSGYEITYKRVQATPARWMCEDFEDEGMEYEYYGPAGTGELIGDGVKNTDESDIGTICEASGFVAYRGHGSDTGSLYGLKVYGPNQEEGYLSGTEAATLDLPPQTSFFVACMNAKIHGTDFGEDAPDVELEELFCLNYLYGGAVALGGATEVSYSNLGQDVTSLWAEYGRGILHDENDHDWDLNNAWFAFFWDGVMDHEEEHGTVGKALQWAENRYIKNHDNTVSPFDSTEDGDLGAHWKEVAMYAIYGDPAFQPHITSPGPNDYDPWHNGNDDM
ncbi:MAG: hypothetical protein JSV49_03315 [Thermoplasmata archaeon]|nr:MAG: hypothetical protein JSV49_03315 [Thermoplasmata archaeon]